ncbi:4Fe-4S dicluster domain-containing protein [Methylacidiphilum caldifontis]|uniref:Sulfite reductase subunit A n=1 Tax=Methylacidiphilum caldifontis TaxID=2795386 RepID=A0A4Y8PC05_9BACT|nr:4Fe-4S dicluster domain-containing protein [Methylacidiphilum caldifontis]QSR87962.1 4Fe-4S dicluster domain-containing protein [Methylacidiphilum caldifontis]TFE68723.1 sulfite reductase subunit A [Methylacidiphilum caldifontis]
MNSKKFKISKNALQSLIDHLKAEGFKTIGPKVSRNAIVYDEIDSLDDFPIGIGDEQEAGKYKLKKNPYPTLFGFASSPHSWKQFLFLAQEKIFSFRSPLNNNEAPSIEPPMFQSTPLAFIGVRSCDLHALSIQNRVFQEGPYIHSGYKVRSQHLFILAVNCTHPSATCFCSSMGTGPKAKKGYDLLLTEIVESNKAPYYVIEPGTACGEELLSLIQKENVSEEELNKEQQTLKEAEQKITRQLDTHGIKELLYNNLNHPRWEQTALRCLSCANCTFVCPTCFCSTLIDIPRKANEVERWMVWDSCFSLEFTHTPSGSTRKTVLARYRQWMTHKLASWIDQFGTSGCVGCGRCITWCPVGIDITEEAAIIRKTSPIEKLS